MSESYVDLAAKLEALQDERFTETTDVLDLAWGLMREAATALRSLSAEITQLDNMGLQACEMQDAAEQKAARYGVALQQIAGRSLGTAFHNQATLSQVLTIARKALVEDEAGVPAGATTVHQPTTQADV